MAEPYLISLEHLYNQARLVMVSIERSKAIVSRQRSPCLRVQLTKEHLEDRILRALAEVNQLILSNPK